MPSSLTPQQAAELNKSIIAYLSAHGLAETLAAFRKESDFPDNMFDATAAKQYENLLERKWTSNSTLMKKLLVLESHNKALQNELNSTRPSFLNHNADVNDWLPQHPIRSLESHRDSINCIAFHPKYSLIASGSGDLTIRIWDWEDSTLERTLKGHTMAVCDVDYGDTSSGILLASCSSDFTIKLWDTTDDYKNVKTLRGHDHIVSAVRFIPSGNLLASASRDMKVILWNVINGYRVKTIEDHTGWVRDISPSFDGQFLLSTGDDMTVRLWEISASQPICKFTATGHENRILCCAVAPATSFRYLASFLESRGSTIAAEITATGSRDKTIKLWDSRGRCIMTLTGHASWVRAIAFHPGGKYILSVSDDKTMRCWDLSQQGRCVKSISNAHDGFITCLKWAPGIAKDTRNGTMTISYQRKGSAELPRSKLDEVGQPGVQIRCVLATGGEDQKIRVFALQANDRSHK